MLMPRVLAAAFLRACGVRAAAKAVDSKEQARGMLRSPAYFAALYSSVFQNVSHTSCLIERYHTDADVPITMTRTAQNADISMRSNRCAQRESVAQSSAARRSDAEGR